MTSFFCITLRSTPERTEHARLQFERENVPVTWVYGIDAYLFAIKPHLWMHGNPDGSKYYISAGACGLVLSHYMAICFAERDDAEDFVIFEDDVILPEGFLDKLEQVKRECPKDTLGVWLEYCCVDPGRMTKASGSLHRAQPMCTAAVWYKKEAIPILLKAIVPAHAPVDILIKIRGTELKPCVTYPQMCHQATYSGNMNSLIQGSTLHGSLPDEPPGEIA